MNLTNIIFILQLGVLLSGLNANLLPNRLQTNGYFYNSQINGWLKLHKTPEDWLSARTSCHLEGAALVLPWTGGFTSAVNQLQALTGSSSAYSGVHITQTAYYEGLYGYSGAPTVFVEPNFQRLKLCGLFNVNGSLGHVDCNERYPYVCFVSENKGPVPAPSIPTSEVTLPKVNTNGYEFSKTTGHWYKFHAERTMSWVEARRACESEGARLAVPNSDDEAKFLIGLHARYLDKEIINTDWPDWVAVGVLWENNNWKTVDGQTLDESGYKTWKAGWPGNKGNYVVMDRGGRYSNTENVLYPYVCEKVSVN